MDKSSILDEIRRTAQANGGKPLGQTAFASDTGIKVYDWNRYWARWSEALAEAGFSANVFNQPLDIKELLEKYAQLTAELGHLPSFGDLRVRRNADLLFPRAATFGDRLGTKSALIR